MSLLFKKKRCILGSGSSPESVYCTPVCPAYSYHGGCLYLQAIKFIFNEEKIKGSVLETGKSIEDLIVENYDKLKTYCERLARNLHLGEDICHEVLQRALKNKDKFSPEQPLLPWLLKTAKNLFIDYYRREKLNRVSELPPHSISEEDVAAKIENMEILSLFAVAALTDRQRRALELVYIEGMSIEEAAREMSLSYKGFYSLLKRAEKKMKEEIKDFY